MDSLLDIAICSGLGLHVNEQNLTKVIHHIPKKCFGVFVTVKRSKYQRLKKWPEEIHGCIGDWDHKYKELSKHKLLNMIKSVSYKATNEDDRRKHFKSIYLDSHAYYDISFMLKPVYSVNISDGIMNNNIKYNNSEYGLIVVDDNGNRATYLPHVFPNKSWDKIKQLLKKKAGVDKSIKFYAYKTYEVSKEIYKIFNNEYIQLYYSGFINFLNNNYRSFIPYMIDSKNKIHIDKKQHVRNIATINDSIYFNKNLTKHVKKNIVDNLKYYKTLFENDKDNMRQSSSFLLLALYKLNIYPNTIKMICNYLYESIDHLEEKFELGEVLIALNNVCPIKHILLKEQYKMYNKLFNMKQTNIDDIFQYNWQAKYLYSLYIQGYTKISKKSYIQLHSNELMKRIFKILPKMNVHIETNYLSVTFEALFSLLPLIQNNRDKILILDNILNIFYMLQKRYKDGLFYFNNNTARLDITGHVINGLLII